MNPDTAEKDEVRRLLELLRTLMRMLAFSNREVERRMGLNHSTLSRVFGGVVEAKLELVLGVARAALCGRPGRPSGRLPQQGGHAGCAYGILRTAPTEARLFCRAGPT